MKLYKKTAPRRVDKQADEIIRRHLAAREAKERQRQWLRRARSDVKRQILRLRDRLKDIQEPLRVVLPHRGLFGPGERIIGKELVTAYAKLEEELQDFENIIDRMHKETRRESGHPAFLTPLVLELAKLVPKTDRLNTARAIVVHLKRSGIRTSAQSVMQLLRNASIR